MHRFNFECWRTRSDPSRPGPIGTPSNTYGKTPNAGLFGAWVQSQLDLCALPGGPHRPALGEDVAWGESNAVVFANSILGARTNRYGDLLDICMALVGRAPYYGLHVPENRYATLAIDLSELPEPLKQSESFFPVLGAWLGRTVGSTVPVITGLTGSISEDRLKALGAGSASTGAVGLFHIVGRTPEAHTVAAATGGTIDIETIVPSVQDFRRERDQLSHGVQGPIDCVAVGSPHFSYPESRQLLSLFQNRAARIPFYVCTNRFVLAKLEKEQLLEPLRNAGVVLVIDTCVAVAPILKGNSGVMMTNSAKFAHYGPGNTGYQSVFGSLEDCVESAVQGKLVRDEALWLEA